MNGKQNSHLNPSLTQARFDPSIVNNSSFQSYEKKWDELKESPFMKPVATKSPPTGEEWIHEVKWNGVRIIARKRNQRVELVDENGSDWADRFKELSMELNSICDNDFVMDGEVVVLDGNGRTNKKLLMDSMEGGSSEEVCFYAFDLLELWGQDLRDSSLLSRKKLLRHWLYEKKTITNRIFFSIHIRDTPAKLLKLVRNLNLSGIVSKNIKSPYTTGKSEAWLKFEFNEKNLKGHSRRKIQLEPAPFPLNDPLDNLINMDETTDFQPGAKRIGA